MRSPFTPIRVLPLFLIGLTVATASDLPEGKGKDAVENTCADCHTLERIKTQHRDEEGWNSIIHEMIENGASINSDDIKVIVDYLAKNFGPVKTKKVDQASKSLTTVP